MRRRVALLALALSLTSCGDDAAGEPLVSGTLMGSYDGADFEPINGYASTYMGQPFIALGTGPIRCGSEESPSPPPGYNAVVRAPDFAVGSYGSVFVQLYANVSGFEGVGSNGGSLDITAVTADTVSGSIDYAYTDGDGRMFTLSGTFEVVLCQ